MSIVLYACIGIVIHAGAVYWTCFGFYCFEKILKILNDDEKE